MACTRTRTHVYVQFANPYLDCDTCHQPVTAWHDGDHCGCHWLCAWNMPCEHPAGTTSACPSWSPVDGCRCAEQLGSVDHRPATERG